MEIPIDHTTFASSAKRTQNTGRRRAIIKKDGLVGMMVVAFIQATQIVTAELCVARTGLGWDLLVQVMDSGLAQQDPVVIILPAKMDLRRTRQRILERHMMLVFGHGYHKEVLNLVIPCRLC